MKKKFLKGIYPGLMVKQEETNEFFIKSTEEINENSLLFEIDGKIINNRYLEDNNKMLKNKNHKYFYFFTRKYVLSFGNAEGATQRCLKIKKTIILLAWSAPKIIYKKLLIIYFKPFF